jgi:hypothetical protein
MTLFERFDFRLPVLRIPNVCEGCGQSFACEIGLKGCWCSKVDVSEKTRKVLKEKYRRCLCRSCLETAETETQTRESQD